MSNEQLFNTVCDLAQAALYGDKNAAIICAEEIASEYATLGLGDETQRMQAIIAEHYETLPPVAPSAAMSSADVILSILRDAKSSALPPLAWLEITRKHDIDTETFLRVVQMLESTAIIYRHEISSRVYLYRLNAYKKKEEEARAGLPD
jgi:hypothetical protein